MVRLRKLVLAAAAVMALAIAAGRLDGPYVADLTRSRSHEVVALGAISKATPGEGWADASPAFVLEKPRVPR